MSIFYAASFDVIKEIISRENDAKIINCSNYNILDVIELPSNQDLFDEDRKKIFIDCNFLLGKNDKKNIEYIGNDKKNDYYFVSDGSKKPSFKCFQLTIDDKTLNEIVDREINILGLEISNELKKLLVNLCNKNLTELHNNLNILANSNYKSITEEQIFELFSKTIDKNIFEFSTFLLDGKKQKALELLENLWLDKKRGISIINASADMILISYLYELSKKRGMNYNQQLEIFGNKMWMCRKIPKTLDLLKVRDIAKKLYTYTYNVLVGACDEYNALRMLILSYDK